MTDDDDLSAHRRAERPRRRVPGDAPGFPAEPLGVVPARTPGSVRRTSRMIATWPAGPRGRLRVDGLARDVYTPDDGGARVLAEAAIDVTFSPGRVIEAIEVRPPVGEPTQLIGSGPGRGFRRAIRAGFPDAEAQASLAFFLVEDLTTAPLLSTFALSRRAETNDLFVELSSGPIEVMQDVCAGYRSGGLAIELRRRNDQRSQNVALVEPVAGGDPTAAWHELEAPPGPAMCRRRRIDVERRGDAFVVEADFRDHSWDLDGRQSVVHEYELGAHIEPDADGRPIVSSLEARPRVVPYPDCPSAAAGVGRLQGAPVAELRSRVLDQLRGVDSCTHLNDMVRALAELPDLMADWPRS